MTDRLRTALIVIHCSATKPSQDIGRAELDAMHRARGFRCIGYHFVIRRNGELETGRGIDEIGAHVEGFNSTSVGVCMVGGLDDIGREMKADQIAPFSEAQWTTVHALVRRLRHRYPGARVVGHRDLSPDLNHDGRIQSREWLKSCPGFDVASAFPV